MDDSLFIENKNCAKKKLGNVCVLGLGKSGYALAEYLSNFLGNRVNSVYVYANKKNENSLTMADKLLKKSVNVVFVKNCFTKEFDLCIVSPGIAPHSRIYKCAKNQCRELIGEIEFAWRECDSKARWIAITGTNGKTTTVSLITHIINQSRLNAVSVGNIGNVCIEEVYKDTKKSIYNKTDIYVAELSSYQLHTINNFSPYISSILNISPDHIIWHEGFENYKKDKLKVFNNSHYAVINNDDIYKNEYIEAVKEKNCLCTIIKFNNNDNFIVSVDKNGVEKNIFKISDLTIKGKHNFDNANVAACVCKLIGISDKDIIKGLKSFTALEHRIEPCGIAAGIKFFNDSKATNTDATINAMSAFSKYNAIFLMGGTDKKTNLDELIKKSYDHLKGVIVYGEAKERFYQEFLNKKNIQNNSKFILKKADNMKSAFELCLELAFPGDSIVLSPACASFDEFKNFEHRGIVFKDLVRACKL